MSSDSTKKRRIADEVSNNNDDNGVGIVGSSTTAIIAEMKEHMREMQNKMDGMQNEMNGMKSRLSRMDELEDKCQHQEEKCNTLEDRCDSLQRSIQILNKENKWEYSAPPIYTSHWTGLGFDEDYIDDMEALVKAIRNKTNIIREERGRMECITLGEESNSNGAAGTLLQYDKVILPHWKELATALQLCQNNNIHFTIQNVQLGTSLFSLLIPAFKGKLQDLFLDNNDFVNISEGIKFIAECMETNRQMKEFGLSNNQLESVDNVHLVLDAIISHPSINKVRLENCLGGDMNSYDALCYLLASDKSFECVDFDRNNIQTQGGSAISDYISNNPPLENLLLSGNKLNDDDAILIAQALKQNTNLGWLHLYYNDFTDIGCQTLSKAVYNPTCLNSVYDCNHTCQIHLDGIDRDLPRWCNNSGVSNPKSKRRMKMHYILSLRHKERSNVQHLNLEFEDDDDEGGLALKIVPKVLETVYKHSNTRRGPSSVAHKLDHPLSIMYEILRGWKMPELYGNSGESGGGLE